MSLYTVGYKWVTVVCGVIFEFNEIKLLYTKYDSERRRSAYNIT